MGYLEKSHNFFLTFGGEVLSNPTDIHNEYSSIMREYFSHIAQEDIATLPSVI